MTRKLLARWNRPGIVCAAAVAVIASLVLLLQAALALDVPPLRGRVNDYAGLLSTGVVNQLDLLLKDFEQKDSTQIVVLTVPSLEGDSLEDFSMRVAEQWKIGHKGLDNGAILLVARADRKVRIEVGYGLEGRLTDLTAGRIIREVVLPEFRAGHFDRGVVNGVQAMIDSVRGEFKADKRRGAGGIEPGALSDAAPFLILFIFLVFSLGRVSRALGTIGGGFLMPFLGHMAFAPGMGALIALAVGGLVSGFVLSLMGGLAPPGSMGRNGRRPGGWGGGFPSGGGFFTGGGGFSGGGFSGGGGGFGGGGASGSW
jgi:uncharacterized protein